MYRDPADIIRIVAEYHGYPVSVLTGRQRLRPIVEARHMAMYLACRYGAGFAGVGRAFGRDHTTVRHGQRRVAYRLEHDLQARRDLEFLTDRIECPTHRLADRFPPEMQERVRQIIAAGAEKARDAMAGHLAKHLTRIIGDIK